MCAKAPSGLDSLRILMDFRTIFRLHEQAIIFETAPACLCLSVRTSQFVVFVLVSSNSTAKPRKINLVNDKMRDDEIDLVNDEMRDHEIDR